METEAIRYLAAAGVMGIGTIAPALAEGYIAAQYMDTSGRNPEISDVLFTKMIVAMALVESLAIYALVIALVIIFV